MYNDKTTISPTEQTCGGARIFFLCIQQMPQSSKYFVSLWMNAKRIHRLEWIFLLNFGEFLTTIKTIGISWRGTKRISNEWRQTPFSSKTYLFEIIK